MIILKNFKFYMYGCFANLYVCAPCIYLVLRPAREGIRSPGIGDIGGCDLPRRCWELNLGLLESLLLTPELSLQP